MKVEFVPVWKQVTPELAQELVAFWQEQKAVLDPATAQRRVDQVVCIARDADGALCGVGTALLKIIPRLRQPTYYYRQFFAKALRGQHQELPFFLRCKQVLQQYNAGLQRPESLGICSRSRTRRSPPPTNVRWNPDSMPFSSDIRRVACNSASPISRTPSCNHRRG